jgi:hypothetical protein
MVIKKVEPFILQKGILYRMGQDNRFRYCVTIDETQMILQEFNETISGAHFVVDIIKKKILDVGY